MLVKAVESPAKKCITIAWPAGVLLRLITALG